VVGTTSGRRAKLNSNPLTSFEPICDLVEAPNVILGQQRITLPHACRSDERVALQARGGRWIVPNLGWQYMFYIGGLPALLALFLLRLLPESPQAGGRTSEATETLAFIEKEVEKATLAPLPNIGPLAESVETKRASWADLFGPVYLGRTSLLWLCWFATYLVNYGLTTWLPSVYQQVFKFAAGAGTLFSSFLCAIFIDRVGRRIFGSVWWFRCQAADALVDWADHAGTCARAHHTQLYVHQHAIAGHGSLYGGNVSHPDAGPRQWSGHRLATRCVDRGTPRGRQSGRAWRSRDRFSCLRRDARPRSRRSLALGRAR
jgi:hypothetical protein